MSTNTVKGLLVIALILSANEAYADYDKLTRSNYEESESVRGVILFGVNWGRQWGCAGFENAQLQGLTFSRIDPASDNLSKENIALRTPAKLFSKNISISYAVIVDPGEYALTGFDIKVAKSSREVGHLRGEEADLFENGNPAGGTFEVGAGEIVYIGDFGLDCAGDEPILWRYYIQREDFESYVAGFREKYRFVADKKVAYRLFRTDRFGN